MWDTATCTSPKPGRNHTSVTTSHAEAGTFIAVASKCEAPLRQIAKDFGIAYISQSYA